MTKEQIEAIKARSGEISTVSTYNLTKRRLVAIIDQAYICDIPALLAEITERDREIDLIKRMYAKVCEDKCTSDAETERLREAQRWIPVMERLPEPKSYVLITDCFGAVREGYYEKAFITRFRTEIKATHWMPLPQPPIGKGD